MTEGKFTESDAENDGLVKREAGQQLNSVLARESGELYTKFRKYCDKIGRDPSTVLGDMVLRSIQNDDYAQELASVVVDVERLNSGEVKREDLEMVTDIIEQFSEDDDQGQDPVDRMLEERLSAVGQGPLGAVNEQRQQNTAGKDQRIRELEREIQQLKQQGQQQQVQNDAPTREEPEPDTNDTTPEIDDLFDDGGEQEEVGEGQDDDEGESDDPFQVESEKEESDDDDEEDIEVVDLGDGVDEPEVDESDDPMTGEPDDPFDTENAATDVGDNE